MIIAPEKLTVESIRAIVESVIMREGTDYGIDELSLNEKIDILMPQVLCGEVLISYDESSESVNLLPKHEAQAEPA
ncbi:MAG: YheU family protein [Agarilytica sp.]